MLLKIDFESETPIYLQLKNQIIEGIAKNELKEGESLPSVRQLAEDIGINMHTVNKTYNILKQQGFIAIHKRKGVIVSSKEEMKRSGYIDVLREEITPVASESFLRGVSKEEFIRLCSEILDSYNGEE